MLRISLSGIPVHAPDACWISLHLVAFNIAVITVSTEGLPCFVPTVNEGLQCFTPKVNEMIWRLCCIASLCRWYELVLAAEEDIATIMTMEGGKPLKESKGEFASGYVPRDISL